MKKYLSLMLGMSLVMCSVSLIMTAAEAPEHQKAEHQKSEEHKDAKPAPAEHKPDHQPEHQPEHQPAHTK